MAEHRTLDELRTEAAGCTNCSLHEAASQTVFGEGPETAPIMLVGEQPGDQEDRQGRPFVGPAGQLLDRAMQEAGLGRDSVYVTNAVKHFKFIMSGKRRLHQKPGGQEIDACKPWLLSELDTVRPGLVVAMGATAAQALKGKTVTIGKERGRFQPWGEGRELFVTVHPSYLLRLPEPALQEREYGRFVDELRMIAAWKPTATAAEPAVRTTGSGQMSMF